MGDDLLASEGPHSRDLQIVISTGRQRIVEDHSNQAAVREAPVDVLFLTPEKERADLLLLDGENASVGRPPGDLEPGRIPGVQRSRVDFLGKQHVDDMTRRIDDFVLARSDRLERTSGDPGEDGGPHLVDLSVAVRVDLEHRVRDRGSERHASDRVGSQGHRRPSKPPSGIRIGGRDDVEVRRHRSASGPHRDLVVRRLGGDDRPEPAVFDAPVLGQREPGNRRGRVGGGRGPSSRGDVDDVQDDLVAGREDRTRSERKRGGDHPLETVDRIGLLGGEEPAENRAQLPPGPTVPPHQIPRGIEVADARPVEAEKNGGFEEVFSQGDLAPGLGERPEPRRENRARDPEPLAEKLGRRGRQGVGEAGQLARGIGEHLREELDLRRHHETLGGEGSSSADGDIDLESRLNPDIGASGRRNDPSRSERLDPEGPDCGIPGSQAVDLADRRAHHADTRQSRRREHELETVHRRRAQVRERQPEVVLETRADHRRMTDRDGEAGIAHDHCTAGTSGDGTETSRQPFQHSLDLDVDDVRALPETLEQEFCLPGGLGDEDPDVVGRPELSVRSG